MPYSKSIVIGILMAIIGLGLRPVGAESLKLSEVKREDLPWDMQHAFTAVETLQSKLLVVYNQQAADSRELAYAYAAARGLGKDQLFGLSCSTAETITRAEFEQQIRVPLRQHLLASGKLESMPTVVKKGEATHILEVAARNDVWAMVLIRGIPLRVAQDPNHVPKGNIPPLFIKNEASVDSELTLLVFDPVEAAGFVPNPYHSQIHPTPFNEIFARSLIMVTRLDAPDAGQVRRMIRDSIETEKLELAGRAVVDARGITDSASGYRLGDDWLRAAARLLRNEGLEVMLDDQPELLPEQEPLGRVALYAGWYHHNMTGPFLRDEFQFARGAVAYHIHSFSASTLRDARTAWAGPLITKGAAATMGSVYEPYLQLTPNVAMFVRGLLSGQTFAEAAYQSQPVLSWTMTMVGDPLYRPFPRPMLENAKIAQEQNHPDSPWLCLRLARRIIQEPISKESRIERVTAMVEALPHGVTYEGLGDMLAEIEGEYVLREEAYRKAEGLYEKPFDQIRCGLKRARLLAIHSDAEATMKEYERLLAVHPVDAPRYGVPQEALKYAASAGWTLLSPQLQSFLVPVGQKSGNAAEKPTSAPPGGEAGRDAGGMPAPRRDLIPPKPVLAPPSRPADGSLPPTVDPNRIPPSVR
ncbi:MAG: TIGR03790 family protein [Candidatus Methylacidiphilales bacterium]